MTYYHTPPPTPSPHPQWNYTKNIKSLIKIGCFFFTFQTSFKAMNIAKKTKISYALPTNFLRLKMK